MPRPGQATCPCPACFDPLCPLRPLCLLRLKYHDHVTAAILRHVRTFAGRYALVVVVCQVAVLSSTTIVLAASTPSGALTVAAVEECSCEHTAGVMCPMHRRSSSRPAPSNGPRWCSGADASSYAVLPAFGQLAMPEHLAQFAFAITESTAPAPRIEAPRPFDRPPDSPPPRA